MATSLKVFVPLIIIAIGFFALFAHVTSRGRFHVDCGGMDEAACQVLFHEAAAQGEGPTSFVPVTRVQIVITGDDLETCNEIFERLIFSTTLIHECR